MQHYLLGCCTHTTSVEASYRLYLEEFHKIAFTPEDIHKNNMGLPPKNMGLPLKNFVKGSLIFSLFTLGDFVKN